MNIASSLPHRAQKTPDMTAVYFPAGHRPDHGVRYQNISYHNLNQTVDTTAWGLKQRGVKPGERFILMIRPGIDFVSITFALLKLGAIVVLIDPGIEKKYLKKAIAHVKPDGFLGIPKAHLLRWLWPSAFRTSRHNIIVGKKWWWGQTTLSQLKSFSDPFPCEDLSPDTEAAIIFTTGSTGPPKGVIYTHGMFEAQIKMLKDSYGIEEGEIDLPTFPLFVLFSVAMGTTAVIPEMDPTRPAHVDPQKIVQALTEFHVTLSFGSPALWNRVTDYCLQKHIDLPLIKRIFIAGAPVPVYLHERFEQILSPGAYAYTPYGATEALPVTQIDHRTILRNTRLGKGICVGHPFKNTALKIIRITDEPIARWSDVLELPQGEIGEIIVSGPHVTRTYFDEPDKTALAKIPDPTGGFWHRMGDIGTIDPQGRLWFCGRKNHRVVSGHQTFFTIPCEAIFNTHRDVSRSALVGVRGETVIIIEPKDKLILKDKHRQKKFRNELHVLARAHPLTQEFQHFLFHPNFPVDIRHNSKIFREKLALWAAREMS